MSDVRWNNAFFLLWKHSIRSPLWIVMVSFRSISAFRSRHHLLTPFQTRRSELFSAVADDGDTVRRMLESSWNSSMMGRIPADPESAAKEAYSSILQAAGSTKTGNTTAGIFFVDLLLPAYDISQVIEGVKLYDEVTAVEYCIALADCFEGKTEILVRDDNIVETVKRVVKARDEREQEKTRVNDGDVVFGGENFVDNSKRSSDDSNEDTDYDPDSDDFRKKLLANWNVDQDTPEDGIDIRPFKFDKGTEKAAKSKSYRLASLFGNTKINEGPDMVTGVIQAVRENALAAEDEDNIIILSAVGKDEMVAVRGLVAKYQSCKKIVMVNCQFQPIPRELLAAETVYSVLPLAGKKITDGGNINSSNDNANTSPKIVVLRRYPKDWEIFVDVGIGYELAQTVAVNGSNKRGLGMEFIARAVTRHLDFVSRRY